MARPAISFTRFSSKPQEYGDSRRRQVQAFNDFCLYHKLYPLPDFEYHEAGRSAFTLALLKGKLGKLIEKAKRGEFPPDTVLVEEDFDRLCRMPLEDAEDLFKEILRCGLAIGICTHNKIYERSEI